MLSLFDYGVMVAYIIVVFWIAIRAARKETAEGYLIANRKLGVLSTMLTVNASKTGSIIMIFVAMLYIWGFAAIWYFVGAALGIIAFIPFAMYVKRTSTNEDYTLPQYFTRRFGEYAGKAAAAGVLIVLFGNLVLNLIAGAKVITLVTRFNYLSAVITMMLIVVAYVSVSGYRAVVRTDALQYVAMIGIGVLLAIVLFSGATVPAAEWTITTDPVTFSGFFLLGLLIPFSSADLWQRVHSSRGVRELKQGLLLSTGFYLLFAFALALIGLAIKATLPGLDPELALAQGMITLLPAGLAGLSAVLLVSALMSTLDTYLFTASVTVVQDFMSRKKKNAVKNIKRAGVVIAILGALAAGLIASLVTAAYLFTAIGVIVSVTVLYTWAQKHAVQRTLLCMMGIGTAGLLWYTIATLNAGDINPLIIAVAIAGTIAGLVVGKILELVKPHTGKQQT